MDFHAVWKDATPTSHPERSQSGVRKAAIARSTVRILAVLVRKSRSAAQFTAFEPFRKIAFSIDSCASTIANSPSEQSRSRGGRCRVSRPKRQNCLS
jgi:hypothetical protein